MIVLLFCLERVYFTLSTNGSLGQSQQLKSLDQYRAGPLIFTARSEIAFELAAIKTSPIFGLGSSPSLTYTILNQTQMINQILGVKTEMTSAYKTALANGKVPQHSILFSSWIEGGILLFSFWIIITLWTVEKFIKILKGSQPIGSFATYFGISTIWAILLSPLGAGSRMELTIGLISLHLQSKFGNNEISD